MSSIIEGYNYDIFISYRQKDNKYDGWVTEFIDHLNREIEATFKEDVSIYFDENPHDGLLEIHNVDKSLETKLKSLIFIPIISQTYCDPKSFAWQNEFVAFNKMVGQDQVGMDVKVANGNVCSRIIPIKIHDLDTSDTELIENEMGCRIRSIDFIYKSAGVNRPLRANEDHPQDNLNKTYYRDQINKVANAVKEIIYGLHPDEKKRITKTYLTRTQAGYSEDEARPVSKKLPSQKRLLGKFIVTSAFGLMLILAMLFLIPKLIQKSGKQTSADETIKKSVAVMPVLNFTGNPELGWIAEMIQSDLTGYLQGINNLIVRPNQTTFQFRNSVESVQQIARKLSVNNLIESSIKGTEDSLEIEIRVIEAYPEERYLYRSSFNKSFKELTSIYNEIINRILRSLEVKATLQEEKFSSVLHSVNPEVRKACARGLYYMNQLTVEGAELGIKYYKEAIAIDPADPEPYIGLALGYGTGGHEANLFPGALDLAKAYAIKAIELDPEELHPNLGDAHIVLALRYFCYDYDFVKGQYHLDRGINLNPNSPAAHYLYGWYFALINKLDQAAVEMRKAIEIDPLEPSWSGNLALLYQWFGHYEEAITYAQDVLKQNPTYPMALYVLGYGYSKTGRHKEAIEIQKKVYESNSGFENGLGVAYALAGQRDKALEIAGEIEKQNIAWSAWGLAEIYAALGDNDKAIHWIEEMYRQRQDFTPWVRVNPHYKILRDDQRFKAIINRLNLPE
jgi:tetratricopeptide (TPR) repeat protein